MLSYLRSNQELTGRDKELQQIDSWPTSLARSRSGVLLSGEAGVGKSKLNGRTGQTLA
ncbi:MAG: hypothetical protein U0401_05390 [Anaerolineae bacterium]